VELKRSLHLIIKESSQGMNTVENVTHISEYSAGKGQSGKRVGNQKA